MAPAGLQESRCDHGFQQVPISSVSWRCFPHGTVCAPTIVGAIEVLPPQHRLGTNIVGAMEVLRLGPPAEPLWRTNNQPPLREDFPWHRLDPENKFWPLPRTLQVLLSSV